MATEDKRERWPSERSPFGTPDPPEPRLKMPEPTGEPDTKGIRPDAGKRTAPHGDALDVQVYVDGKPLGEWVRPSDPSLISRQWREVGPEEASSSWSEGDHLTVVRDADGTTVYNDTLGEQCRTVTLRAAEAIPAGAEVEATPEGEVAPITPIDRYLMSYSGEPRGGIVKDVAFNRKSFGPGQPENPDQNSIYVGADGIVVTLEQDFRDEELQHFFSFAINATRGIDPRNPPDPVDWEEMMRGGLQTALKRINIAFAVYGASRTATHQIVRSTRANFHQQSQRAHYYGDRPSVRMPESWLGKWPERSGITLAEEFAKLAEHSAAVYRLATDAGVSYQDARFALLEGTTNFILCEYSLDEFINVYAYRGCSMFQWEIVWIMRQMRQRLIERHPWLEPYVKISCEKTKGAVSRSQIHNDPGNSHACTFQGWEEVEGQCDFPWAREANRTFRSERHAIKKGGS